MANASCLTSSTRLLEIAVKKSWFCIGALLASPQAVFAQSSVTLYGLVTAGVTYVNNTGKGPVYESETCAPPGCNRWGLKGREDLGGGSAAIFTLENGFNIQNGRLGQGGTEFGRQAFVGLTNSYGTITLGRQYDSLSDTVGMFPSSNNFATGYGSHFGDLDNLNQSIRINNVIKYVSPVWNGLQVDGMFSLGGQAGDFSTNRVWALAGSYTAGPFALAAGYLDINTPATNANGTGGVYASNGNYVGSLSNYVALQDANAMKVLSAGASYSIGNANVGVVYSHTVLKNSQYFVANGFANAGSGSDFKLDSYAYIYNAGKADYEGLKPTFQQINLGANYSLSKRTSLFAVAVFQKAGGDGIAPVFNSAGANVGRTAIAEIAGAGVDSSSAKQVLVSVGITHTF